MLVLSFLHWPSFIWTNTTSLELNIFLNFPFTSAIIILQILCIIALCCDILPWLAVNCSLHSRPASNEMFAVPFPVSRSKVSDTTVTALRFRRLYAGNKHKLSHYLKRTPVSQRLATVRVPLIYNSLINSAYFHPGYC